MLLSIGEASLAMENHSREAGSLSLGNLGDQGASGQTLRNRDPVLHGAANGTWGTSGGDHALDSLISAISERYSAVDLASTRVLQQLDEPLRELILQTLAGSQQARDKLVIRNDPRALVPLVKALGNWDLPVRRAAAVTLKALGECTPGSFSCRRSVAELRIGRQRGYVICAGLRLRRVCRRPGSTCRGFGGVVQRRIRPALHRLPSRCSG